MNLIAAQLFANLQEWIADQDSIDLAESVLPDEDIAALTGLPLEFARTKLAGNTKQIKNCKKGFSCGYSCISQSKKCGNPLEGQSKTYADYLAQQASKLKPYEMSVWQWANRYRPKVVESIQAKQRSDGMGQKGLIEANAKLWDEHREIVEKAVAKGIKVPDEVIAQHPGLGKKLFSGTSPQPPKPQGKSFRDGKGYTSISLTKETSFWANGLPSKKAKNIDDAANHIKKLGIAEIDAKFQIYEGKPANPQIEKYMKRISAIAEKAGYEVSKPENWNNQGHIFPSHYIATLTKKALT